MLFKCVLGEEKKSYSEGVLKEGQEILKGREWEEHVGGVDPEEGGSRVHLGQGEIPSGPEQGEDEESTLDTPGWGAGPETLTDSTRETVLLRGNLFVSGPGHHGNCCRSDTSCPDIFLLDLASAQRPWDPSPGWCLILALVPLPLCVSLLLSRLSPKSSVQPAGIGSPPLPNSSSPQAPSLS